MNKNPYEKNTKIYTLFEKIIENEELYNFLFQNIQNNIQLITKGYGHLHNCILKLKDYIFLDDYIQKYLDIYPETVNIQDECGFTALMRSCQHGTEETVKNILKYGGDVNMQNFAGQTSLFFAMRNLKMIKMLIKSGSMINIQDMNGDTPLIFSFYNERDKNIDKSIKFLLEYSANVNIQNLYGETVLFAATLLSNSVDDIEMLLKHDANINIQNYDGQTVLMMTILFSNAYDDKYPMIKLLIDNNANIEVNNSKDNNAVTIAFKRIWSNGKSALDIILPNRKKFNNATVINIKKILRTKFWKAGCCDFKLVLPSIINFNQILDKF